MTALSASSRANPSFKAVSRPAPPAERRFSRPRFALVVLAGVYPLITGLLYLLLPLLHGWPIWRVTLVVSPIMVATMIWGLIPAVQRVFRTFLNPTVN